MIKPKTEKKCACCGKVFKPFKSTDKYCSYKCANSSKKCVKSSENRSKPTKMRSNKRAKEEKEYSELRKEYLLCTLNVCPVALHILGKAIKCTEIHHKAGRIGKLLNYTPLWMAVSREGHNWIHDNPEESYKRGWLVHSSTVKFK